MQLTRLALRYQGRTLTATTTTAFSRGILSTPSSLSSLSSSSSSSSFSSTFRSFSHKNSSFKRNALLPGSIVSTGNGNCAGRFFKSTSARSQDEEDDEMMNKAVVAAAKATPKKKKPWILDLGVPSMLPEWKNMFRSETIMTDISAGLTVGCIAVPLSLAIAVASGVPAEVGLVTAAVSGVAGGMIGGTTLAITGPAAAISLLVVGAVQEHGLEALPFITLACGGLQLVSGVTRLGVAAKLVPVSVIAGFTTGVGTMILTGQVPKALGIPAPSGLNPIETLSFIGENIASMSPAAASLALGTSAAMYFLPKIHPKIPSALLAVGGATVATHALGLDVTLIGSIPSGLEAFQFGIPMIPPVEALPSLSATVFLIYAMTSAESLLSCAALEKMKKTSYKHNPDQELIGQGLANMGSAMFMGMPVTSVIARSGLNVRLNAETRLPALVQSGFVFSSVVFFSSTIGMIPMPALSGMLITTGMGMLNPTEFKHCYAVQDEDVLPFLTTFGGMIAFGLAEGIGIGCLTAFVLNCDHGNLKVKDVVLPLTQSKDGTFRYDGEADPNEAGHSVTTWQLTGPINFRNMFVIDELMHRLQDRKVAEPIVLDMQGVTSVEFTGVEELVNRLVELADSVDPNHDDHAIQMWNCHSNLMNALTLCNTSQDLYASKTAPYHDIPKLPEKPKPKEVPFWYDSPTYRPR